MRAGALLMAAALLAAGCTAAEATRMDPGNAPKAMTVRSEAYAEGAPIPKQYTCEGSDVSPPFTVADVPTRAKSLAVVMEDPDAPRGTWLHWTAWNLPSSVARFASGLNVSSLGGKEGKNDGGDIGYGGPCPPPGAPHRYYLRVYALDSMLNLTDGAPLKDLAKAAKGKIVAWGELMGTYRR